MSRTKDQWLEETGGLRLGESEGDFQKRVADIQKIRAAIKGGTATVADVDRLAKLLGTDDEDE